LPVPRPFRPIDGIRFFFFFFLNFLTMPQNPPKTQKSPEGLRFAAGEKSGSGRAGS
jgi:hypothetical protein